MLLLNWIEENNYRDQLSSERDLKWIMLVPPYQRGIGSRTTPPSKPQMLKSLT